MSATYLKKPLPFAAQLSLLVSRGLIIGDPKRALELLGCFGYYRLSAYFPVYQHTRDVFDRGTSFQTIVDTYLFDSKLRILLFEAIEKIEIAVRTQLVYQMAIEHGDSHWQDDLTMFQKFRHNPNSSLSSYASLQRILEDFRNNRTAKKTPVFIQHYFKKYNSPKNPPSWMCIELLTIGALSKLFTELRSKADKQRIALYFQLDSDVFSSWFHTLVYIRNICAHHSRLWNIGLGVKPVQIKKKPVAWVDLSLDNGRLFYTICIIKHLLNCLPVHNEFANDLNNLFHAYDHIPIRLMGIPVNTEGQIINWQNEPLFRYGETLDRFNG